MLILVHWYMPTLHNVLSHKILIPGYCAFPYASDIWVASFTLLLLFYFLLLMVYSLFIGLWPLFQFPHHIHRRCPPLCVVSVPGYRSRGPGSIPGATRFSEKWWVWNGGPLNFVSTIEELRVLGRKSSGSGLENREYSCRDSSHWLRITLYPQKFALASLSSGDR
jgi:hypothetical protein